MRPAAWALLVLSVGCSNQPATPPPAATSTTPVRITQFYATAPKFVPGEKELLCYGVENAKRVWLSPPRQELSAALSRCVEVHPERETTYTLTAEDEAGKTVTQEVQIGVGAAHVHIVEVKVSSLDVKRGDEVSICYTVQNAKRVWIEPSGGRTGKCTIVQPQQTTTYTVHAEGPEGDRDQEHVTAKVH